MPPVTQTEQGGKDLILKVGSAVPAYTTDATTATIVSAAHGLLVGDIWAPTATGASATILAGHFYFVKTVPTTGTFTVSATQSGAGIIPGVIITAQASVGYTNVGGIRSKSFSVSAEEIDISNEDSTEWKNILDGAGMRSVAISGSGVVTSKASFVALQTAFLANALVQLIFLEVKSVQVWSAYFKVNSLEKSGDYNAESGLSISASSSGAVVLQAMG